MGLCGTKSRCRARSVTPNPVLSVFPESVAHTAVSVTVHTCTFMFEASRRFTFLHCFAPTCYGKQWTSFSHTFTIVTVRTPGNWSEWSECSATCGKGMQTSVRTCYAGDTRPTSHCPHPTLRTQICHKPCPGITWNSWTLTSLCRYNV